MSLKCRQSPEASQRLAVLSPQQIARQLLPVREADARPPGSILRHDRPLLPGKKGKTTLKPSAVLMPLIRRSQEWFVLLIRRSQTVGSHKGQIAFPGGRWEDDDPSLLQTALRETREELGPTVVPTEILGGLPSVTTHATGFIIHPFVALMKEPLALKPEQREVDEVLILPLSLFLSPSVNEPVTFVTTDARTIWGATARITHQFIEKLRQGDLL